MTSRRERGAGGIFIVAVLLVTMVVLLAMLTLRRTSTSVDEQQQTKANLATAAAALEQFAGASGRLPCPADPTKDDGVASPNSASVSCDFPQGTVPWATIGMRRDDAFDAWGWKISYRVYSNVTGSLTQDQGASMVNCDTSPTLGSDGVDTKKLCRSTHATLPTEFVAAKGLQVTDFGTPYGPGTNNGAAYVLISHGATGLGGYTAAGTQRNSPKSNEEKNNLKATGPFVAMAASPPDVGSEDNSHFDDVLVFRTLSDLATRANLSARDWPDNLASLSFTASSLQAALGQTTPPTAGSSLGVSSLRFYGATVTSSGGNITYDTDGGTEGIGVSGSGTAIGGGESMSVSFAATAKRLAISLNDFGGTTVPFFGFIPETATLRFYLNGTLKNTTTISGCQNSVPSGGPLASFTVTPGVTFDQVQITPFFSSFFLSAVSSCDASGPACLTALDNGEPPANGGNHCS
jgi:type II secretory pathway pseudopilin PulG